MTESDDRRAARNARYEAVEAYLTPVDGYTLVAVPGSDLFGYRLQSCDTCSALVTDVKNHEEFHAAPNAIEQSAQPDSGPVLSVGPLTSTKTPTSGESSD